MRVKHKVIFDNAIDRFLGNKNVTGIFIGYKYKNGKWTNKLSLQVHVKEKIPSEYLKRKEKVPKKLKGMQTDVVQSCPTLSATYQERQETLYPGLSVGPEIFDLYGTLGAFVYDSDNKVYLLTSEDYMKPQKLFI